MTWSGWTASADICSRSALMSTRTTVPTLWTPRAIRMCMQPIGPAPKTTVKSPSSMPSCSWALMAQANGSAAEASSKPTLSGIRLRPSTLSTCSGTIMYSANPPSYW